MPEEQKLKDLIEAVNLHEELIKDKKANKNTIRIVELYISGCTSHNISDLKTLIDAYNVVQSSMLKAQLKDLIFNVLPEVREVQPIETPRINPYFDYNKYLSTGYPVPPYQIICTTTWEPQSVQKTYKKGDKQK